MLIKRKPPITLKGGGNDDTDSLVGRSKENGEWMNGSSFLRGGLNALHFSPVTTIDVLLKWENEI